MEQGIRMSLLVSLLLFTASSIHSQTAGDIDTLSQWRVDAEVANSYGVVYDHFKYFIDGDTVINANTYFKVYKSGYTYFWEYSGGITDSVYYDHMYVRPLREKDNRWYTINNYPGEDVLLYDFTLEIGDTLESFAGIAIISNVDSILIDGVYKRKLDWHYDFDQGYFIEDIGASSGLFESFLFFENFSTLYCYAIDYVVLWNNPAGGECDLSVDVHEFQISTIISAFPNPLTNYTAIEFELYSVCNMQFTVYNNMGDVVYEKVTQLLLPGNHIVSWSPGPLPAGLYFGVLKLDDNVEVIKLLKQ
jgi:hypothetical protein